MNLAERLEKWCESASVSTKIEIYQDRGRQRYSLDVTSLHAKFVTGTNGFERHINIEPTEDYQYAMQAEVRKTEGRPSQSENENPLGKAVIEEGIYRGRRYIVSDENIETFLNLLKKEAEKVTEADLKKKIIGAQG